MLIIRKKELIWEEVHAVRCRLQNDWLRGRYWAWALLLDTLLLLQGFERSCTLSQGCQNATTQTLQRSSANAVATCSSACRPPVRIPAAFPFCSRKSRSEVCLEEPGLALASLPADGGVGRRNVGWLVDWRVGGPVGLSVGGCVSLGVGRRVDLGAVKQTRAWHCC